MTKSELIQRATQEMALEIMGDNIATIAGDVSDMQLDILTIREELNELKDIVRNWGKNKSGKTDTDKGTQD